MKNNFFVMDSDFHMMEPHNLWDRYLEDRFKAQAPKITPNPHVAGIVGMETVSVNGKLPVSQSDPKAARTRADLRRRALSQTPHYARALAREFDPETHIEAMDIEGVDVGIVYSTRGRQVLAIDDLDPQFGAALARAYNNWAYDYCQYNSQRLRLAAQLRADGRYVLQVDHEALNVRSGPLRKQFLTWRPREREDCSPKSTGAHYGARRRKY